MTIRMFAGFAVIILMVIFGLVKKTRRNNFRCDIQAFGLQDFFQLLSGLFLLLSDKKLPNGIGCRCLAPGASFAWGHALQKSI